MPYKYHSDVLQDAHELYSLSPTPSSLSHTRNTLTSDSIVSLFDVVNKLFSFFDEVVMDTDSL
jgi:hypothetical protein